VHAHIVKKATFLPFDPNAFRFFSSDPKDPLSPSSQETAFRLFNFMVGHSSLGVSPDAVELIQGWYGGDVQDGTKGPFNGDFVPAGWRDGGAGEELYKQLVAVACRTCHISAVPSIDLGRVNFSTFKAFTSLGSTFFVKERMCGDRYRYSSGRMPAAEQTLKELWQSSGREHFFAQIPGNFGDCGLK
jgi:hypothetical protein